jgi:hypothetical protein
VGFHPLVETREVAQRVVWLAHRARPLSPEERGVSGMLADDGVVHES